MKNIIVFASGSGSNAENIIRYFNKAGSTKQVKLLVCNKPDAAVITKAERLNIPVMLVNKEKFNSPQFIEELKSYQPDLIALMGFLWLIPADLAEAFEGKMINLHPALLPKFGGKGMYGMNVHKTVVDTGEKESGITIHWVTKEYDKGAIIFQAKCDVLPADTAVEVAHKIHELEQTYVPQVINELLE